MPRLAKVGLSLTALATCLLLATPSQAQFTKTGGSATLSNLSTPGNIGVGKHQDNKAFFWFTEQTSVNATAAGLNADITTGGLYDYQTHTGLSPGAINGLVNSYLLYTDPKSQPKTFDITLKFSQNILGLIIKSNSLDTSDSKVGLSNVTYPFNDSARGQELQKGEDWISWNATTNEITIHNNTHDNVDEIRVLTRTPVPEPAFYQLSALLCLGGLGLLRRHRR